MRSFHSPDGAVQEVIANCINDPSSLSGAATTCDTLLNCILSNVDAETSAQWSAGAGILAFIPTLLTMISNDFNHVLAVAHRNVFLGILLALSAPGTPSIKFVVGLRTDYDPNIVREDIEAFIERQRARLGAHLSAMRAGRKPRNRQVGTVIYVGCCLAAGCGLTWYTVYRLVHYGVILFSCSQIGHVAIWLGLTQATCIIDILFMRRTRAIRKVEIDIREQPGNVDGEMRKAIIIVFDQNHSSAAINIRAIILLAAVTLFTYATGMFAAMTMYPAGDSLRALGMVVGAALCARAVVAMVIVPGENQLWRGITAISVPKRHFDAVERLALEIAEGPKIEQQMHEAASTERKRATTM